MKQEEKQAYYAVIPANVRYDKNLSANAKLIYGEISALCNQKGFCWAQDRYFAELYGVSERSIRNWINKLVEFGYIFRNFRYKEGTKEVEERCLSIVKGMEENFHTCGKNLPRGMEENFREVWKKSSEYNNTIPNTTTNNILSPLPPYGNRLTEKVEEFLAYKKEKRQSYTDIGLKALIKKICESADEFGADAVCDVIELTMQNNWQGIVWERLGLSETLKPNPQRDLANGRKYTKDELDSRFQNLEQLENLEV